MEFLISFLVIGSKNNSFLSGIIVRSKYKLNIINKRIAPI